MALTTVQGVIDGLRSPESVIKSMTGGVSGRWGSGWFEGGVPLAGGGGAATPGTALTGPVTGGIPFTNPVSGETLLARIQLGIQTHPGDLMLVDRLWHMSGLNPLATTAQTVNSAAWPARDVNQSADGRGVYVALQVSTVTGAASPTLSYTYTNSAGTGSRTASNIFATSSSAPRGATFIMGLAAGDVGVRSVQDFTLSVSWAAGAASLIAFRPIAFIPGTPTIVGPGKLRRVVRDALTLAAPRIWNGSVLELWCAPNGTSASPYAIGTVTFSQG